MSLSSTGGDSVLSSRLCFSTLACPGWSLEQILDAASAAGVRGIDFRGIQDHLDVTQHPAFNAGLDRTLAMLAERGLCMPCLNSSVRLVETDPIVWRAIAGEFARYAALAARTSTPMIRVFGGKLPPGVARTDALALARSHLQELIQLAAGRCIPVIETHDAWRTSPAVLDLLDGFAPQAAVLWDIEHTFRAGESPADTVHHLGEHLRHVHIKDSRRPNDVYQPLLLGDGELPVMDSIAQLVQSGYRNWICLETEKRWHPSAPEPDVSIEQFASYVRAALGRHRE